MKWALILACIGSLRSINADTAEIDDIVFIGGVWEEPDSAILNPNDRQTCTPCVCGQGGDISRIVGGEEVPEGSYPWMVRLKFSNADETFGCGGTVINDLYILTAAHCIPSIETNTTAWLKLTSQSDPNESAISIEAESIKVHEDYVKDLLENDLALVKLSERIDFSIISPVCLPSTISTYDGINATAVGWGFIHKDGPESDVPLRTYLEIRPHATCEEEYGTLPEFMMCAGPEEGGHSICFGDSGGPLQYMDDSRGGFVQVGVSSWVDKECSRPRGFSVFAKLDYYYDWIINNTGDGCSCADPVGYNIV